MSDHPQPAVVYLIPTALHESSIECIPGYILPAILDCKAFFVENERSARRFMKSLSKSIVIDDYRWYTIHKNEGQVLSSFHRELKSGNNIGILSEAGCPGVADPGQLLVAAAQNSGATVRPLVGPSSLLLALMASGFNGQRFQFHGYLPIAQTDKVKELKQLEADSIKRNCTQLFIETPYRNNQLLQSMVENLQPTTRLCIAADITSPEEFIKTKPLVEWKRNMPNLHKRPVIFIIHAGRS